MSEIFTDWAGNEIKPGMVIEYLCPAEIITSSFSWYLFNMPDGSIHSEKHGEFTGPFQHRVYLGTVIQRPEGLAYQCDSFTRFLKFLSTKDYPGYKLCIKGVSDDLTNV